MQHQSTMNHHHTNKPPIQHPITKVFVGNISERAPDTMIRQMLQRCGNVLNWKRVEGTNGKLQAFGFCDFAEPQYTLRYYIKFFFKNI